MKRILILLITVLLLSACGSKTHENISKDMIDDTEQVLSVIDKVVEEGEDLSGNDLQVINQYTEKYEALRRSEDLTTGGLSEEERTLLTVVNLIIEIHEIYLEDRTGMHDYDDMKSTVYDIIKTGKIKPE